MEDCVFYYPGIQQVFTKGSVNIVRLSPYNKAVFKNNQCVPAAAFQYKGTCFPAYAQYLENIRKGNVLKPSDKTHLNSNPFGIITILPELRVLPFCPRLPVEPLYYYD